MPDDRRVLVFPSLDASASEVARLEQATGLLTPVHTTWRRKPVVIDAKAVVDVTGNDTSVHLTVERANGWRTATIPLLETTGAHAVAQDIDLLRALVDEIERLRPRGSDRVVKLLREQIRYMRHDPGPLHQSPLTHRLAGRLDRITRGLPW